MNYGIKVGGTSGPKKTNGLNWTHNYKSRKPMDKNNSGAKLGTCSYTSGKDKVTHFA